MTLFAGRGTADRPHLRDAGCLSGLAAPRQAVKRRRMQTKQDKVVVTLMTSLVHMF